MFCSFLAVPRFQAAAADIGYAEGTEVIAGDKVEIYSEDKAAGRMLSVGSKKSHES